MTWTRTVGVAGGHSLELKEEFTLTLHALRRLVSARLQPGTAMAGPRGCGCAAAPGGGEGGALAQVHIPAHPPPRTPMHTHCRRLPGAVGALRPLLCVDARRLPGHAHPPKGLLGLPPLPARAGQCTGVCVLVRVCVCVCVRVSVCLVSMCM